MKLTLAPIFLLSAVNLASGETYYSGSDLSGIESYGDASELCANVGNILATEAEWCAYAKENPGAAYGVAPILDSECIDVETACGITTPAPTKAPTARPGVIQRTRAGVPGSSSGSSSGGRIVRTRQRVGGRKLEECSSPKSVLCMPAPTPRLAPPPDNNKGSSSGDPHFKTWTGDKFDYHGECDLVLVENPSFNNGQGLRVHIRTTRIKYFSYIERIAVQIGDDILEFNNDVEDFYINGSKVDAQKKHHKTMLGGFWVRRDPMAISIRIAEGTGLHQKTGAAKIDLHTRKNGFPAVIVDGGRSEIFKGSLGLLGEWGTGKKLARDGKSILEDATDFALEWQVRGGDIEPMLFMESRFPQFPNTCTPPEAMPRNGLGASLLKKEAEEACAHWEDDMEDCIFDVMAVGDTAVAQEGHIAHVE